MPDRGEQGLTLVEVLVVLAIIGVMGSIAVLGLSGADRGGATQSEARRLAQSIQLAADEAMVTDRMLGLQWDEDGYSFVQWSRQAKAWQGYETDGLGGRHQLPENMDIVGPADAPLLIGEDRKLELTVSDGSESWSVRFDGLNAAATPANDG